MVTRETVNDCDFSVVPWYLINAAIIQTQHNAELWLCAHTCVDLGARESQNNKEKAKQR